MKAQSESDILADIVLWLHPGTEWPIWPNWRD